MELVRPIGQRTHLMWQAWGYPAIRKEPQRSRGLAQQRTTLSPRIQRSYAMETSAFVPGSSFAPSCDGVVTVARMGTNGVLVRIGKRQKLFISLPNPWRSVLIPSFSR